MTLRRAFLPGAAALGAVASWSIGHAGAAVSLAAITLLLSGLDGLLGARAHPIAVIKEADSGPAPVDPVAAAVDDTELTAALRRGEAEGARAVQASLGFFGTVSDGASQSIGQARRRWIPLPAAWPPSSRTSRWRPAR